MTRKEKSTSQQEHSGPFSVPVDWAALARPPEDEEAQEVAPPPGRAAKPEQVIVEVGKYKVNLTPGRHTVSKSP